MMGDENQGMYGPVEKTDRISRLPDDIRELILGFFCRLTDAVRTSVLSQKWKFSWTITTQLEGSHVIYVVHY